MSQKESFLLRSRLHIKSGKILLDHGKLIHGVSTLFDAVEYGMKWYILEEKLLSLEQLSTRSLEELIHLIHNYKGHFNFDFFEFQDLMEELLEYEEEPKLDTKLLWNELQSFFEKLQVMPFVIDQDPLKDPETRSILGLD